MKVLTAPRAAAALEYRALRAPAQLIQTKLVARYLPAESGLRLGVERALGTIDKAAGRLLDDPALVRRGESLCRHADVLETAVALEEKARLRREEAAATVETEKKKAAVQRKKAAETQQAAARQVRQDELVAKRDAERIAQARADAAIAAVDRTVEAVVATQEQKVKSAEVRIDKRLAARTAAPSAKLRDAAATRAAAAREKTEAERLAQLAATERAARKARKKS